MLLLCRRNMMRAKGDVMWCDRQYQPWPRVPLQDHGEIILSDADKDAAHKYFWSKQWNMRRSSFSDTRLWGTSMNIIS
eukprot:1070136-Pelagomonas_calceolata.AAC.2